MNIQLATRPEEIFDTAVHRYSEGEDISDGGDDMRLIASRLSDASGLNAPHVTT